MTKLSEPQSRAFVSYYGLPEEFPKADTAESNFQLADAAITESAKHPDGWDATDNVLELGITSAHDLAVSMAQRRWVS